MWSLGVCHSIFEFESKASCNSKDKYEKMKNYNGIEQYTINIVIQSDWFYLEMCNNSMNFK